MANSMMTQISAIRGPRPARRASSAATSGPVIAGAATCGTASARFHTPIALAIASRGSTAYAIDQSAVKNAPQATPDAIAHTSDTATVGAAANAPTEIAIATHATVTMRRLSRRSVGRPAIAAPMTPAIVNARISIPVVVRASGAPSDSRTKKNKKPNSV